MNAIFQKLRFVGPVGLLTLTVSFAADATAQDVKAKKPSTASERAAARAAAAKRARYDRIVGNSIRNSARLAGRARELEMKAARKKVGRGPWRSLMHSAKRLSRTSFRELDKYRKVDLSPTVRKALDSALKDRRREVTTIYSQLIEVHAALGHKSTVRRLAKELLKLDPKALKGAAAAAAAGAGVVPTTGGKRDDYAGRRYYPRGGGRPTGEDLRYWGRRGASPTPRTGGGRPNVPAPRGGASSPSGGRSSPGRAPSTGGRGAPAPRGR